MLLRFAVKDFLDDREWKNLSSASIKSYEFTLKEFQNYCSDHEIIDLANVLPDTVKNYLMYCKKSRGNKPTSLNHKLSNLKVFFNYLEENDIVEHKNNPIRKITPVKEDIRIEVFTDNQIQQMLRYYQRFRTREKTLYSYRDYLIIVFLLGTGCRRGELVNLRWSDVDLQNLHITFFGKKRIQSSIPMTEKLRRELADYRVFCEQHYEKLPEYVFVDRKGEPMTENAVSNMFKRLAKIMNFKNVRVSCHTFRHTFANRCILAGMSVFTLQKMLRHSELSMTEKYLALWGTALAEQNSKYNPLNNLDI